ncbi:MAG: carbamoyl-phosphate synthase (glutamine-hydrolyzing) large subunit [Patescibacteria group bacterium]|jgi:carbamoyl-phosphate synthase large subunit
MKANKIKKVLVLGSGALKIGEAGEFDYSGSQGLKALKEEGIKTVLVNPNIATIQTSPLIADEIYFLPVTPYFVEKVIIKEKPDGILLSFGGQTALNCGLELHHAGILKKHNVKVLGTPIEAIVLTEDRQKFADHLKSIGVSVPDSGSATSLDQAKKIAGKIGYPVMIRAAYSLGGQKSGIAYNEKELNEIVSAALSVSPQVLVEKYLHHFKEIEYEVVRDAEGNSVTVCNMENMDPLGIHTGESIVVAPSQTLTNDEYHGLRQISVDIVRSLGIVGECNVQFALNPKPKNGQLEYYVIEVNARLSRSSALASKATGYPLAYVAAKLALGKTLNKVQNQVTKITQSFFEPALDYVVVKIPRWDLEKFTGAEEKIGSAMKSVGEVMAIGRSFEEALQKAVRMLAGKAQGITYNGFTGEISDFKKLLEIPTPKRLFDLAEALKREMSIEDIYQITGIDPWFLSRLKNIVEIETDLASDKKLDREKLLRAKQAGLCDRRIGKIVEKTQDEIRTLRKKLGILPSVFQIDTLAGEVPAKTNYLYLTYHGEHHDVKPLGKKAVMVLGSGPYHIGSSVEFDWSCVNTALALKKYKKNSIIVNCNPETVSTDYDMSDRLYFEDLNFETVADIYDFEKSGGIIISVGGQRPNNLANALHEHQVPILGTRASDIDRAEDRNKFSALCDELNIPQPEWNSFTSIEEAKSFAAKVGYPVLVRPSYVLSGSAMSVCFDDEELAAFTEKALGMSDKKYSITVSKFMVNAKEIEYDAVAQNGKVIVFAIAEHLENAGVHSGDATIAYPTQKVFSSTEEEIKKISRELAIALHITGPFNIQFLVKDNKVFVIEINLRASRTFPFLSKATGVNFARLIVDAFYKKCAPVYLKYPEHVVVKSPQFSFSRLTGADPVLKVEMSSTGEVACFGKDLSEALYKSIIASTSLAPGKSALLTLGGPVNKRRLLEAVKQLSDMDYKLYATSGTCGFLKEHGIKSELVYKIHEKKNPTVIDMISGKKAALVINLSEQNGSKIKKAGDQATEGYLIRRAAVDSHIPLFTDLQLARSFIKALTEKKLEDLEIKPWKDYMPKGVSTEL